jgi:hypothetical protein
MKSRSILNCISQIEVLFPYHIKIKEHIHKFNCCLYLFRDNIPAVILAEWELSTEYFDEDFMSGVMPILFARDPRAAEASIKANPVTAMKDLDKLNRIFFIPESVELSAALKIVKRARLGDVDFVFKRKNLDRTFDPALCQISVNYCTYNRASL